MESLNLSCLPPTQATVLPEPQSGDWADAPRFLLVPAFRLPARHLLESLASHVVVLMLVGLISAMQRAPFSAEKSPLNSARPPIILIAYHPVPTKKNNARWRKDEPRRFSPPLGIAKPVVPAVDEPPAVLAAKTELVLQAAPPGVTLAPASAPSSLPVKLGLPMAPTVHVPSLDPGTLRLSSVPLAGKNTGRDPLGPVGPTGLLVKGTGGDGTVYGPPDLSAKPRRSKEQQRQQPEHATFTKPEISFMPKPAYPPAALHDRIEGDVSVKVTFDRNGHVVFRGFVRQLGNEELNSAARETVQRIRFAPATSREGVPVDQDAVVTVTFRLTQLTLTASF